MDLIATGSQLQLATQAQAEDLNVQTHSATSIDVRIEATSSTVGGDTLHGGRFGGVFLAKSQGKLEEAEFVRCIGRANDECFEISDINITTGHGES